MFWDVLLAIAIGLTQLFVTIYGVVIALTEKRMKHAIIIGFVGLTGIGLTVWAGVRNGEVLDTISKNTQLHARIKITPRENNMALPQPLGTDHPLRVNYNYMNVGNETALNPKIFGRVFIEDGNPFDARLAERAWSEFQSWIREHWDTARTKDGTEASIPYWATNEPPFLMLTSDQISNIRSGKSTIYVTVAVYFEDDRGPHTEEQCMFIQTPADPESPWHECGVHDHEITGRPF